MSTSSVDGYEDSEESPVDPLLLEMAQAEKAAEQMKEVRNELESKFKEKKEKKKQGSSAEKKIAGWVQWHSRLYEHILKYDRSVDLEWSLTFVLC